MSRFEKLSHVIWHCQYHIVWIPKYRYKVLNGKIKEEVRKTIIIQAERLGCNIVQTSPFDTSNHPRWLASKPFSEKIGRLIFLTSNNIIGRLIFYLVVFKCNILNSVYYILYYWYNSLS